MASEKGARPPGYASAKNIIDRHKIILEFIRLIPLLTVMWYVELLSG